MINHVSLNSSFLSRLTAPRFISGLLTLLCWLAFSAFLISVEHQSVSRDPLSIDDRNSISVKGNLEIIRDSTGRLSIEESDSGKHFIY